MGKPHRWRDPETQAKATLRPNGSVVLCRTHKITSNRCQVGKGEHAKTYGVGKTVTVGRFACTVESGGVRCVLTASGQGFLFGTGQMRGRRRRAGDAALSGGD